MATTGTTVQANAGAPRRVVRGTLALAVDTTVTPSTGPISGVAGGIGAAELVYLTANNALASLSTPGVSNANAAKCVGVAVGQYPPLLSDGIFAPAPSSSPQDSPPYLSIAEDGDWLFNTTAADNYAPYDLVYLGADGRTISKTATGSSVGYVSPDQRQKPGFGVAPPSFPIAGGSGVQIYIRITPALAK